MSLWKSQCWVTKHYTTVSFVLLQCLPPPLPPRSKAPCCPKDNCMELEGSPASVLHYRAALLNVTLSHLVYKYMPCHCGALKIPSPFYLLIDAFFQLKQWDLLFICKTSFQGILDVHVLPPRKGTGILKCSSSFLDTTLKKKGRLKNHTKFLECTSLLLKI